MSVETQLIEDLKRTASDLAIAQAQVQRLTDLVRFMRSELYEANLISDEEYAALVEDSDHGTRAARLEIYDKIHESQLKLAGQVESLKKALWLRHGHQGMYGDDGEMQCGACAPFGLLDWKRSSVEDILGCLELQSLHAASTASEVKPTGADNAVPDIAMPEAPER